jgi:hypothetical protein
VVNSKFANLLPEQIKEIELLEEKLEVTLLAYDLYTVEQHDPQDNNAAIINPS